MIFLTNPVLQGVSMASFLAATLASKDQPQLVTTALQLVELLLVKLPDSYQYFFRCEGVMHEIERLAVQPILTPAKVKRASTGAKAAPAPDASASTPAGPSAADALVQDLNTRRAQHLRDEYASADSEPAIKARDTLQAIRALVVKLDAVSSGEQAVTTPQEEAAVVNLLAQVEALFSDERRALSSFELLESGLVAGLLRFVTEGGSDRCMFVIPSDSIPPAS